MSMGVNDRAYFEIWTKIGVSSRGEAGGLVSAVANARPNSKDELTRRTFSRGSTGR